MMENVPPELALVLMAICSLIVVVLLLVDRLERTNIMLASRIKILEEELSVWIGEPRKFLEAGLDEPEVITNGR